MPKSHKTKKTSKAKPLHKKLVHTLKSRFTAGNVKIGFMIAVAILAVTALGYAGYGKYQEHTLKAKAAAYAQIVNNRGVTIGVCKVNTIYGYSLQIIATKPAAQNYVLLASSGPSLYGPRKVETSSNSWWGGVVTSKTIYAGNDSWWYGIVVESPGGYPDSFSPTNGQLSMAYTPNC